MAHLGAVSRKFTINVICIWMQSNVAGNMVLCFKGYSLKDIIILASKSMYSISIGSKQAHPCHVGGTAGNHPRVLCGMFNTQKYSYYRAENRDCSYSVAPSQAEVQGFILIRSISGRYCSISSWFSWTNITMWFRPQTRICSRSTRITHSFSFILMIIHSFNLM